MDFPQMPTPMTKNLDKASRDELVQEVVNLRQFVGLLLENLKDFREASGLNEAQNHRLLELEMGVRSLETVAKHSKEVILPGLETRVNQRLDRFGSHINLRLDTLASRIERLESDRK
jgi:hypothetical protein